MLLQPRQAPRQTTSRVRQRNDMRTLFFNGRHVVGWQYAQLYSVWRVRDRLTFQDLKIEPCEFAKAIRDERSDAPLEGVKSLKMRAAITSVCTILDEYRYEEELEEVMYRFAEMCSTIGIRDAWLRAQVQLQLVNRGTLVPIPRICECDISLLLGCPVRMLVSSLFIETFIKQSTEDDYILSNLWM